MALRQWWFVLFRLEKVAVGKDAFLWSLSCIYDTPQEAGEDQLISEADPKIRRTALYSWHPVHGWRHLRSTPSDGWWLPYVACDAECPSDDLAEAMACAVATIVGVTDYAPPADQDEVVDLGAYPPCQPTSN